MSFFNLRGFSSKNRLKKTLPGSSPISPLSSPTLLSPSGGSLSEGNPLYLHPLYSHSSVVKGSFQKIVVLPPYVEANEWISSNLFDFFHHLNLLYGTLTDFCTLKKCPTMSGGPGVEYLWNEPNSKKPQKLPAPQYIDYVMTRIQNLLDDESLFPIKQGVDFSSSFTPVVKGLFSQIFRVYAHIYHNHFDTVLHLSLEAHLNSQFFTLYIIRSPL
ncbi:Maintenance of ploidy protein mob2 [Entomophthora muscae]|uniref:Maintenance of ploidy protein mob2 n=1 Tax=Entomophthora muscae TaxID=34485 RepID=A0ACC2RMY4_9FUNG|nr:Maintenance of ploidy protein mob2 [Entomophthora muscae]